MTQNDFILLASTSVANWLALRTFLRHVVTRCVRYGNLWLLFVARTSYMYSYDGLLTVARYTLDDYVLPICKFSCDFFFLSHYSHYITVVSILWLSYAVIVSIHFVFTLQHIAKHGLSIVIHPSHSWFLSRQLDILSFFSLSVLPNILVFSREISRWRYVGPQLIIVIGSCAVGDQLMMLCDNALCWY